MSTSRGAFETVTVSLPGNREFGAALYRSTDGSSHRMVFRVGFSPDGFDPGRTESIVLPPAALPEIRKALEALEATGLHLEARSGVLFSEAAIRPTER